jgi:Arc/MetJ-type ribon-helix-helix transcriptional regulator
MIATIQLPDDIKRIADDRAAESGYADTSEYVRALILADVDQPITAELEAHLVRARETRLIEVTPEFRAEKYRKLEQLHREGKL